MIEYTNYYHKKLELHKQMINDIRELMKENNLKIIYFGKYPSEVKGYPTVMMRDNDDNIHELEVISVTRVADNLSINVVNDYGISTYDDYSLSTDVLPASIDSLYDSVFSVVNYIKNKQ